MMRLSVRSYFVCIGAPLLLLGIFVLSWLAVRHVKIIDTAGSERKKEFSKEIAEGVRISRSGIYGVDVVTCGRCRLEKRKMGLLTMGGLNVLVLDDLSVVIPPQEDDCVASLNGEEPDTPNDSSVRSLVNRMGLSEGFFKTRGIPLKFSSVKINNLAVSKLTKSGDVEKVFNARRAESARGGLALSECLVYASNAEKPQLAQGAKLEKIGKYLRLRWEGGEVILN